MTYNRLELLKKTVNALETQTSVCDILLVNNASTDGTESWALEHSTLVSEKADSKFLYENTGSNIGGAGGFHYGMKRSVELDYDLVWIMDDDAIPEPDALEKLLEADKKLRTEPAPDPSPYGFLSSIVRWTDGSICVMNRQRLPDHYLEEEDIEKALKDNALLPAECATFVSLLIPTDIIEKVGLPIKEFFIWSDDIEYTSRITKRNRIPAYIVPDSVVIHETKNNAGSDIVLDSAERIDRYRYAIRNGNYAYRHYSARMYASYLFHQLQSLILVWFRSPDHKAKRSRIIISSFLKGFVFHPKKEYVRRPAKD